MFSQASNGLLDPVHKSEIGIVGGCSYYIGDFNESVVPYMVSPMGGVLYRYNFTKYVNVRFQISAGMLKGDSRKYEGGLQGFPTGTNMSFNRTFYSAEAYGEFNFFPYSSIDPKRRQTFSPFLIIGAGYTYFAKNKRDNNPHLSTAITTFPMLYDTAKTAGSVTIPMGFGFKFSPARKWTISAECVFHKTNIDKIDQYINRSSNESFNIFNKDWVSTISLTLSYRFINTNPCATYKSNKSTKRRDYKGINSNYKN